MGAINTSTERPFYSYGSIAHRPEPNKELKISRNPSQIGVPPHLERGHLARIRSS